jgi:hypothetical protein
MFLAPARGRIYTCGMTSGVTTFTPSHLPRTTRQPRAGIQKKILVEGEGEEVDGYLPVEALSFPETNDAAADQPADVGHLVVGELDELRHHRRATGYEKSVSGCSLSLINLLSRLQPCGGFGGRRE